MRPLPLRRWYYGLLALLALCVTGCGATASASTTYAPVGSHATATTAATATALPMASAADWQAAGCGSVMDKSHASDIAIVREGDLLVSRAALAMPYPWNALQSSVPLKPQQVGNPNVPSTGDWLLNPSLGEGYSFAACNASSTTQITITGASLRVDSFTPASEQVNEWNLCDGPYNTETKATSGGCGGGFSTDEMMQVNLPSTITAGTTADAVLVHSGNEYDPTGTYFGPLPVTLAPGKSIGFTVAIGSDLPTGTYTFSFAVKSSGGQTPFVPMHDKPVRLAGVLHKWSGQACMTPDMQAQIPQSSTSTYWVCPQS